MVREDARRHHLGVDVAGAAAHDAQPHLPVIQQDRGVGGEHVEDLGMRDADARGIARRPVQVETEALAAREFGPPAGEFADPELRSLEIGQDPDRPADLRFDCADHGVAHAMVRAAAVAEIEAKHIGAGLEQRADGRRVRAGRPQGRDDLGAAVAAHDASLLRFPALPYPKGAGAGQRPTTMARKSFTLVRVGPVVTRSSSAAKKP